MRDGMNVMDADIRLIEPLDLWRDYIFGHPITEVRILWDNGARLYGLA